MANKDIKVTLTLDSAAFEAGAKGANEILLELKTGLADASAIGKQFDRSLASLTAPLKSSERLLGKMAKQLDEVLDNTSKIADGLESVSGKIAAFASQTDRAIRSMAGTAVATKQTADAARSLRPALDDATKGFKDLEKAQTSHTAVAKNSAIASIDFRKRQVAAERAAALEEIQIQEQQHKKMLEAQRNFQAQYMAAGLEADRLRRSKKAGSAASARKLEQQAAPGFLNAANVAENGAEVAALKSSTLRQRVTEIDGITAALERERAAQVELANAESVRNYVGQKNAETVRKLQESATEAQLAADRKLQASSKTLTDERIKDTKLAGAEAKRQAETVSQMWKSMAQLAAAAKLEKGLGASVNQADEFQRLIVELKAMGKSQSEIEQITQKSWDDSKVLKFASALDIVKTKIQLMGGLPNASAAEIDQLTPMIAKYAHNTGVLSHDTSEEGFVNRIRNASGVIESRGQTQDLKAAQETLDFLLRVETMTGQKLSEKDIEMFGRRDIMGMMMHTNEGLAQLVALMDQFKVSGSGGGGGGGNGGGVGTVGTAIEMILKLFNGSLKTVEATKLLADANMLDLSAYDASGKTPKERFKKLRSAGLKGSDIVAARPLDALHDLANSALAYMSKPENIKRFFPSGDLTDPASRATALSRFATQMGLTKSERGMFVIAGNEDLMTRARAQSEKLGKVNITNNSVDADIMKAYAGNVDAFNTSLHNLEIGLGTGLLPILTKLLENIKPVIDDLSVFTKDHPSVAGFMAISVAIGAVVLALKGFTGMFGTVGKLTDIVSALIRPATGAAVAVEAIGPAATKAAIGASALERAAGLGWIATSKWNKDLGAMLTNMTGLGKPIDEAGTKVDGLATRMTVAGGKIALVAGKIAKGFLMLIPVIGEVVMAYTLTDMLANVTLGGAKVIDWAFYFGDRIYTVLATAWDRVLAKFGDSAAMVRIAAAQRALDLKALGAGIIDQKEFDDRNTKHDAHGHPIDGGKIGVDPTVLAKQKAERDAKAAKAAADREKAQKKLQAKIDAQSRAALNKIVSDGTTKKTREKKEHEDPLTAEIEREKGALKVAQDKVKELEQGREGVVDYMARARDTILAKLNSGAFDPQGDLKKRPKADSLAVQDAIALEAERLEAVEYSKSLTFAHERLAAATNESNEAMLRLGDDGTAKATQAFRALEREMARAEQRMPAASHQSSWLAAKSNAFFEQSNADALNFAADLKDKNKAAAGQYLPTEMERIAAGLDSGAALKEQNTYKKRLGDMQRERDDTVKYLEQEYKDAEAAGTASVELRTRIDKDIAEVDSRFRATSLVLEQEQTKALANEALKRERAFEDPIKALARQWKDTTNELRGMQDGWANDFIESLFKGKAGIKDFVTNVLMELAKLKFKQQLADPLSQVISSGTSWLRTNLFAPAVSATPANPMDDTHELTKMAAKAADSLGDVAKNSAEDAVKTVTSTTALEAQTFAVHQSTIEVAALAPAANLATNALMTFTNALGAGGMGGSIGDLGTVNGGSLAADNIPGVGSFADALAAGVIPFANGGIMSKYGALELRKYANGGVANSPQMAIYGEGSMNEAYVPLPDGRSIPVSMQGGAAPAITVNVVNQSGTPVNAQQGQVRFDGRQAILDVVLTAASAPGPFRDGMKGAMK